MEIVIRTRRSARGASRRGEGDISYYHLTIYNSLVERGGKKGDNLTLVLDAIRFNVGC